MSESEMKAKLFWITQVLYSREDGVVRGKSHFNALGMLPGLDYESVYKTMSSINQSNETTYEHARNLIITNSYPYSLDHLVDLAYQNRVSDEWRDDLLVTPKVFLEVDPKEFNSDEELNPKLSYLYDYFFVIMKSRVISHYGNAQFNPDHFKSSHKYEEVFGFMKYLTRIWEDLSLVSRKSVLDNLLSTFVVKDQITGAYPTEVIKSIDYLNSTNYFKFLKDEKSKYSLVDFMDKMEKCLPPFDLDRVIKYSEVDAEELANYSGYLLKFHDSTLKSLSYGKV